MHEHTETCLKEIARYHRITDELTKVRTTLAKVTEVIDNRPEAAVFSNFAIGNDLTTIPDAINPNEWPTAERIHELVRDRANAKAAAVRSFQESPNGERVALAMPGDWLRKR